MGKVSRQPRTKKTHSSDSRDPIWSLGYTDCKSGCQAGFEHGEIAMRPPGQEEHQNSSEQLTHLGRSSNSGV